MVIAQPIQSKEVMLFTPSKVYRIPSRQIDLSWLKAEWKTDFSFRF